MQYFAYSQKSFVYKYVVMLSDTDQFKHMSFANYLRLMFLATDALLISCLDQEFLCESRLRLLNSRMQFKRQCVSGDHILIKVNSSQIADSDFTLLYTFVIEGTGELVALGRQTYQIQKVNQEKPIFIPKNMKDLLEPISVAEEYLVYKY